MKMHEAVMRSLVPIAIAVLTAAPAAAAMPAAPAEHYTATILQIGSGPADAVIRGEARLVDGEVSASITIDMQGLLPDTTFPWHIHEAVAADPCAPDAAQGPIVTDFRYRRLESSSSGDAHARGKADERSFTVNPARVYYVNVHDPVTGAPIACGVLTP
jgi:hypothetical protein